MMEFVVPESVLAQRIDQVLSNALGVSRSHIKQMIKKGLIQKSGTSIKVSLIVNAGDIITFLTSVTEPALFVPRTRPLEIVYEDNDILVISKPAGIAVHPTHENDT